MKSYLYFLKRIAIAFLQIFIVATILFIALRFMEGDPVLLALGSDKVDAEAVEVIREELGLNKPLLIQYVDWIKSLLKFDLGKSISLNVSVNELVMERFPRTLELAIVSIVLGSILGISAGIVSAMKQGKPGDLMVTSVAAVGISLPVYVLGTLLIYVFSLKFRLLPSSGYKAFTEDALDHIRRLALPSITLALGLSASITRMTRSSMLEVLHKDFVGTLRAKGLSQNAVILKHVFRNTLIPIITVIGLQLGNLIGGMVLIENLYAWPGISALLIQSISYRDYPLIQGCTMVIATFFILINMLVDILYALLDPRIRSRR